MKEYKRPMGRSITKGCIVFFLVLCTLLGSLSYFYFRSTLYQHYNSYISDILNYVDRQIDDEDLIQCIETKERSAKYDELEAFMDGIKEDFHIHYLYILKPQKKSDIWNVMSVVSAEDYYNRYVDQSENLYLGWESVDEYDEETVRDLFDIYDTDEIVFFVEKTDWGTDYTGAVALRNKAGEPYAILAVDIDITEISKMIVTRTVSTAGLIVILGAVFTGIFLIWIRKNVTSPLKLLEKGVVTYVDKSHGKRDVEALHFDAPQIHTENEVESLSKAVTQMTEDMQNYVADLLSAEKKADDIKKHADELSELANKDALTGIRNKTAYDKEMIKIEADIQSGKLDSFGIAMVDLNYLKRINDTYGHEQGNYSIKKLSILICSVFAHSPVFRIGGDEFVVILKGDDLENRKELLERFHQTIRQYDRDENLVPWEKISAAVGVAVYNPLIDEDISQVFKRADENMYACKKEMKALRED